MQSIKENSKCVMCDEGTLGKAREEDAKKVVKCSKCNAEFYEKNDEEKQ